MNFSHREEERDGRLLDVLTDEEQGLRLIVNRAGAELVSLARRDSAGPWAGGGGWVLGWGGSGSRLGPSRGTGGR